MEHQKILNLLNEANDSKFVTRKGNIVNDQSYGKYGERIQIVYDKEVLKSIVFCLQLVMIILIMIRIILYLLSKTTKSYVPVVTLSARDNQKLSKLLSKGFEDQFIGMNIKQNVKIKMQQMSIYIFLNQVFLESIDYLF